MIGIYGIISNEDILDRHERIDAFSRMSNDVDQNDFYNKTISGNNFSIGITSRNIGENKDLSLKAFDDSYIIAFSGYGKYPGDKRLFWANEMIERIRSYTIETDAKEITDIEGSFFALILASGKLQVISDRFSSKSLFYYDTKKVFVFAPDIGRIVSSGLVPKEKNIMAAKQILIYDYFLGDQTLVIGVLRFPPATILNKRISKHGKSAIGKYWNMPKTEGSIDALTPELVEEFHIKMCQAVNELAKLESESVVSLSAGLDSRAIACCISEHQKLNALTFDMRDETDIAEKVVRAVGGQIDRFSNYDVCSAYFRGHLKKIVEEQRFHVVLNQYFYNPLFRKYFTENQDMRGLFDGIYLDVLFNGNRVFSNFKSEDFLRLFGGASIVERITRITDSEIQNMAAGIYNEMTKDFEGSDGVGMSQYFYVISRLIRYVNESLCAKENYAYVLKPGYNYDLTDFAFALSLRLRKGLLYKAMLFRYFPGIMKVQFKDSYGIRMETYAETYHKMYAKGRMMLWNLTKGLIKYSPYQIHFLLLQKKEIEDYKEMFLSTNNIEEIIEDGGKAEIFRMTKRKHYFLPLFERALFLQQFYGRYGF